MENLYTNPWVVIPLTILYAVIGLNFAASVYSLNADPIVIEIDRPESPLGGITIAPFIIIDKACYSYEYLRHGYQHYMQQAVLTPLGFFGIYAGEFLLGTPYEELSFEKEAFAKMNDGLEFEIFDIQKFKKIRIKPEEESE